MSKILPFLLVGCVILFGVNTLHASDEEQFEKLVVQKMRAIQALDSGGTFYLLELVSLGECVKCTITSKNIKEFLLTDSTIAKRCKYIAVPVTQRRKDAVALMEDHTFYDSYISVTSQELSNSGAKVSGKFILLDKSLTVRYTISFDKYISNSIIKELTQECRKIARE